MAVGHRAWIGLKSVFYRITLTRCTAAFFLFSFIHCLTQGILQSFLFSIDLDSAALVRLIVSEAQVATNEFALLTRSNGVFTVDLCNAIPEDKSSTPCHVVYSSAPSNTSGVSSYFLPEVDLANTQELIFHIGERASVEAIYASSGGVSGVQLTTLQPDGDFTSVNLTSQCAQVLVYPQQVLENSSREDLALIGSQFWLFSISFFAILYNSIPHILAALCFRVLATGWSAYQIWRTYDIQIRFQNLVIGPETPCHTDLFPTYFQTRIALQIPDLVLNCTALLIMSFLSWRLVKIYSKYIFSRVGTTQVIIKIYKYFLSVFVCLQLLVYLLVTSMALWIDQLINSSIAKISSHTTIYLALFIFTTVALIPWIMMGWYSVRKEKKRTVAVFLALTFVLIASWSLMFYSEVYRFTFIDWPWFASVTVASFMILILSFVFGVICWLNFNKGLAEYLHVEGVLAKQDFEPELFEHDDLEKGTAVPADTDDELPWSDITVTLSYDGPAHSPPTYSKDDKLSDVLDIKKLHHGK